MTDPKTPTNTEMSEDLFEILDRRDIDVRLVDFVALWYAQRRDHNGVPPLQDLLRASQADTRDRYAIIEPFEDANGHASYRYREVGSAHHQRWGVDIQGKSLADLFPADRAARLKETYDRVLAEGKPDYLRTESQLHGTDPNEFERVVVPVTTSEGLEVIFAVVYWPGRQNGGEDTIDEIAEAFGTPASAATENLRIRVEIEGAPITVENILSTDAAADEASFLGALTPMLRRLRSGLASTQHRHQHGLVRISEVRLEVHVAASLSLMPLNVDETFVDALAPYVEAFRTGVVRATQAAESDPSETREWRVRPRIQTFAGFRLQKASLRLSRQLTDLLNERLKLSLPELRLIATLGQDGMQTISDAAESTNMDRAQVSRTLTKLQKDGLVERFVDKHDRRVTWITLTDKGEELWQEIYPFLRARNEELTRDIDREELRVFYSVLERLSKAAGGDDQNSKPKFSFS